MRTNPKINTGNIGHFRTFRDPLVVKAEARQVKARAPIASPTSTPLSKTIEELAAKAAVLPVIDASRRARKGEFVEVAHPDYPGVTLRASLCHDIDHTFDDLMGQGVDPIGPGKLESIADSDPWSIRRVKAGLEIASRDTSGESRFGRHRCDGPVDLDVREVVKGYLDCGPKGLSRHSRWEAAKASGLNAAADYRRQRRAWAADELIAVGVEVQVRGPDGAELAHNSLWGLDYDNTGNDRSYIRNVVEECAAEALGCLPEAFAKRRAALAATAAQYAALAAAEGDAS